MPRAQADVQRLLRDLPRDPAAQPADQEPGRRGFAANACLQGTLTDALYRNYRIVLLRDCTAAMEYHDTIEEQAITKYVIRFVEAFLGYTATSADFVRSCEEGAT
ncbi:MAG: cysteine hydrolase [Chloroflexi bacterium]|nr:cysteine hydrolase [Chloroflexota bacterium]